MKRILWNRRGNGVSDPGDIDEIVIQNPSCVHIEQMSDDCWWMQIDLPDGSYWAGNFVTRDGRLSFGEQENAGVEWDRDATHETAGTD